MFQRHRRRAAMLLAAADAVAVGMAFESAYRVRVALREPEFFLTPAAKTLVFCAALAAVIAAGRATGTYTRLPGAGRLQTVAHTLRQGVAAGLALLAVLYMLHFEVPVSRMFLGLLLCFLIALQLVFRAMASRAREALERAFGAVSSVVVVGDGPKALEMARALEGAERSGARLLAVVDCGTDLQASDPDWPVRPLADLPALLAGQAIDEVVFVVSLEQLPKLEDAFVLCDEHGVKTRVATDFFPHVHSRVDFDRYGERPLLTFSIGPSDELQLLAKRAFDALFAVLGLAVLAVPMLAVAWLVRLTSPGPAIFRQRRCGLNGRMFDCYKFRSMVEGAESMRPGLEGLNEKDGPAFKMRNDPRLTRLGRFLRRFSIDEWPQLWNVLRGEMSFVGPRPAVPEEVGQYETWQRRRLRMRPGLTCLWAIRGRDRLGFDDWMQADLEYIDRWSLLLDLKILALSVPAVLAGRDAY